MLSLAIQIANGIRRYKCYRYYRENLKAWELRHPKWKERTEKRKRLLRAFSTTTHFMLGYENAYKNNRMWCRVMLDNMLGHKENLYVE